VIHGGSNTGYWMSAMLCRSVVHPWLAATDMGHHAWGVGLGLQVFTGQCSESSLGGNSSVTSWLAGDILGPPPSCGADVRRQAWGGGRVWRDPWAS
jgi:hypothetical protein